MAKKKPKPAQRETSEEVIPQTMQEKVNDAMAACLKDVGTARTCAITLQGLEYADNLSDAIKKHAEKVEKLYTHVQTQLKASPSTSDAVLEKSLKKIEELSQGTQKLQAGTQAEYLTNHNDIHESDGHLPACHVRPIKLLL